MRVLLKRKLRSWLSLQNAFMACLIEVILMIWLFDTANIIPEPRH